MKYAQDANMIMLSMNGIKTATNGWLVKDAGIIIILIMAIRKMENAKH